MYYTVIFYKPEISIADINLSHKIADRLVRAYREEGEPAYYLAHPDLFESDEEAIKYFNSSVRAI